MSIEPVNSNDIILLKEIAEKAVYETVDAPEEDKPDILSGISKNIEEWHGKEECVFLKYSQNSKVIGFVLIKEYWNFSDIFVLPKYHGNSIGRKLAEYAIQICKEQSDRKSIRVNSSKNTAGFYRLLGFKEIDLGKALPYEMVPLEYNF